MRYTLTERKRYYNRELSKRVVINLTISDYKRWKSAADFKGQPLAAMIRSLTENYITELENDWEMSVTDLIEYQEDLRKEGVIV